jgi:hypothetical protein
MTMPKERTRALRLAGELLREVMYSSKCPESLWCQAQTILRHYPSALDIAHQAKQCDPQGRAFCWLGPENTACLVTDSRVLYSLGGGLARDDRAHRHVSLTKEVRVDEA